MRIPEHDELSVGRPPLNLVIHVLQSATADGVNSADQGEEIGVYLLVCCRPTGLVGHESKGAGFQNIREVEIIAAYADRNESSPTTQSVILRRLVILPGAEV